MATQDNYVPTTWRYVQPDVGGGFTLLTREQSKEVWLVIGPPKIVDETVADLLAAFPANLYSTRVTTLDSCAEAKAVEVSVRRFGD